MKHLEQVKEFMQVGGQYIAPHPQINEVNRKLISLRIDLIQEELNELLKALTDDDLIEVCDALADLQYVLTGAVLTFGFQDIIKDVTTLVHKSNMSKFCKTEEEAQYSLDHYFSKGVSVYIRFIDGHYLILRTSDNKILKSIDYQPVNLTQIIKDEISNKTT